MNLKTTDLNSKKAQNSFDKKEAAKYCVAVANTGGGRIFFGITDKRPREVTGTQAFGDLQATEKYISDVAKLKLQVIERAYEGKRVVEIIVPSRPRGRALSIDGTFWTRTGESLEGMTFDELIRINEEGAVSYTQEDSNILPVTALELSDLLDVQSFFDLRDEPLPSNLETIASALEAFNLIRAHKPDKWVILKSGALLLAKSLNKFTLGRHRVRLIVYRDSDRIDTAKELFYESCYAITFPQIMDYLDTVLPIREDMSNGIRKVTELYPKVALRELIANSLVHQDFTLHNSGNCPTIEIFPDRVEMANDGEPLIDVQRFVSENKQRNWEFSDAMRKLNLCEGRGSGIDRALQALEKVHGSAPEFQKETYSTRAILLGDEAYDRMSNEQRLWSAYMHCCLKWAGRDYMTNGSLRERFNLLATKASNISGLISQLLERGKIKIDPSGPQGNKGRRYIPDYA